MKLINSSYEILTPNNNHLDGILSFITKVGYTCYKTNKEITPEVAKTFTDGLIQRGHGAMLEHGTVYLKMIWDSYNIEEKVGFLRYKKNPYSRVVFVNETHTDKLLTYAYITTNYRVMVENGWLSDLQYITEPTKYHERRYTVKFITDRGVSHEMVRHRTMSFAQESTRYCNYGRERFGNEITYIKPTWYDDSEPVIKSSFESFLKYSEDTYLDLIDHQYTPQQARQVLPNALKTEIVVTGFTKDWEHFFNLRALDKTGPAHPDIKALALPLYEEFLERSYISSND